MQGKERSNLEPAYCSQNMSPVVVVIQNGWNGGGNDDGRWRVDVVLVHNIYRNNGDYG